MNTPLAQRFWQRQELWLAVGAALLAILVAIPILGLFSNLFFHPSQGGSSATWQHLLNTVLPDYALSSIALSILVVAGVLMLGVTTAWCVVMFEFPGRRMLQTALLLPLAMPAYVSAYAYTDFLQFTGPLQTWLRNTFGWEAGDYWFPDIRSLGGAAILFIVTLYPYVYLLARTSFMERSPSLNDAARILGANAWQRFWRITLPLARPAMIAGAMLALMETLADYGTVSYFGVNTFTTGIYRAWFSLGDRQTAAQLASLLLMFVLLLLCLEHMARGRARFYASGQRPPSAKSKRLSFAKQGLTLLWCGLPILVGFLLPVALLVRLLWQEWQAQNELALFHERYWNWAGNTVQLALLTAVLAVLLALLLAYAARLLQNRLQQWIQRITNLGYAVPGAVLAVGVLIPLARLDNLLAAWIEHFFGFNPGLLLTGSIAALVYAYLVRFFAIAFQSVEAGLTKVTPSMDASARSLGLAPLQVLRRVHLPLLSRSLLAAGLLVFVDVMKELPATLVLRPFNHDTLAVIAHQFAADERLAEAALPALTIVLVGLLPVVLLSRAMTKQSTNTAT